MIIGDIVSLDARRTEIFGIGIGETDAVVHTRIFLAVHITALEHWEVGNRAAFLGVVDLMQNEAILTGNAV